MKNMYIKPLIISICAVIFQSIMYFLVKSFMSEPIILSSNIDSTIPFNPWGAIPYSLWYFLLFLIPILYYNKDKDLFVKYIISYISISIVADIIFLLYPTMIIRPDLNSNGVLYQLLQIIYNIDNPAVNCFPSLHCAVATLWILFSSSNKINEKYKYPIIFISILVFPSTLLTKQHVLIDVIGGIILGIVVFFVVKKIKTKELSINKYI